MRRVLLSLWAVLALAASGWGAPADGAAPADKWHYFWYTVKRDFHRNNCWPDPFIYPERASVHAALSAQVANGWRMQNLLGDAYFHPNSNELNQAGRERVKWILTQAPPQYRTVFVQRGDTADVTTGRVDAVQQYAVRILPQGQLPAVEDTHLIPRGWPADYINTVYGSFEKTTPAPRLPAAKSGTSE